MKKQIRNVAVIVMLASLVVDGQIVDTKQMILTK